MSDHIDRAAEIIDAHIRGWPTTALGLPEHIARALDATGLLATPERDAEVRADERAKVLAGFEWEPDDCSVEFRTHGQNCQCFGPRTGPRVGRWVGPWEPIPDD